jgi:hypothetical protein
MTISLQTQHSHTQFRGSFSRNFRSQLSPSLLLRYEFVVKFKLVPKVTNNSKLEKTSISLLTLTKAPPKFKFGDYRFALGFWIGVKLLWEFVGYPTIGLGGGKGSKA